MQLPRNLFPPIDFAYITTYYFLRFPTISTILGSPMEFNSIIPGRWKTKDKLLGPTVWLGGPFDWGLLCDIWSTFFPSCSFWPLYILLTPIFKMSTLFRVFSRFLRCHSWKNLWKIVSSIISKNQATAGTRPYLLSEQILMVNLSTLPKSWLQRCAGLGLSDRVRVRVWDAINPQGRVRV